MLAAELLQRDGYYRESRPILEAINRRLDGEDQVRVSLRLGDARFHEEVQEDRPTFTESGKAWKRARRRSKRRGRLWFACFAQDPATMLTEIPRLGQLSSPRADSGAEALYLLGQVDRSQKRRRCDCRVWFLDASVWGQDSGSDVPERFWNVYSAHVRERAQIGRWFEVQPCMNRCGTRR